jgi:acyl-coenzyme A synthetase/AMP-(fatty) acid ligase
LYYLGRATDRITTARGTVYPHLVEDTILGHGSVLLCCVVGLGEPGSQQVVAAVQVKEGFTPSDHLAEEILAQAARLPDYQRPVRAVFVRDMPTVLGGAKVQRQALRERLTPDRP